MNSVDSAGLDTELHRSLSFLLEVSSAEVPWESVVDLAAERAGWTEARRVSLRARETDALQMLAVELNEMRQL